MLTARLRNPITEQNHKIGGVCALSLATVTDSLGLPPAPSIFGAAQVGAGDQEQPLAFLDLPAPENGPAPDPGALYCPPEASLYPFQADGVRYLMEHPVVLLGDEMGLGKSIQAIAALRLLIHRGEVNRALILCPKTLVFDWHFKLRQWAPDLRVIPVEGPKRRRGWYWQCKTHINVVGYETWREDLKEKTADPRAFDLVICDEVQRIKNPDSLIHRAVASLSAPWRWGLSGTPLENSVEELLAIFGFLKPGLLPVEKHYPVGPLRRTIEPYVLRRRKVDVLQLPPKESQTVWLELTPPQRTAYAAAERAGVVSLQQAGYAAAPVIALTMLTKLKQICNLEETTGASCKMSYLEGELARLGRGGEKALVFSQYPEKTLRPLLYRFEPYSAALFDGSLSDWNRQLLIHRFQNTTDPRVLAMSLKAGGVGITLTRANHVYHFDHWWNPAAAQQAEDRTHRIGQQKPVRVTTLLTRDTVEERIAELLEQKRQLFHQVMDPLTDTEAAEELAVSKLLTREDLLRLLGVQH